MAAALLLLLLAATGAAASPPCQGHWSSRCWDAAVAARCGWEQQCQHLWDSLGNGTAGHGAADGHGAEQDRKIKCNLCTSVLKRMQALAGDDPDEAAVAAALQKGCRALGRRVGKLCQQLVSKYREQITEGLQNGDKPRDICASLRICRS